MKGRDLTPTELIQRYGGRARKRFGQNFLTQPTTLERIVDLAQLQEGDRLVEIGPGPGALTSTILRRNVPLTAVELDRDLAEHLRDTFGDDPYFTLIEGDALTLDWSTIFERGATKVIANLPYNVATPILLNLIDQPRPPSRLVLMFQKEVADRICAPIGSRASGWLTVAIASRFRAHVALKVPPGAFVPAPKVHSSVIVLQEREVALLSREEEQDLRALAERAFTQRRKTLRNNLKGLFTEEELERAGVPHTLRAEALTWEQWAQLVGSLDEAQRTSLRAQTRT